MSEEVVFVMSSCCFLGCLGMSNLFFGIFYNIVVIEVMFIDEFVIFVVVVCVSFVVKEVNRFFFSE